MLKGSLILCSCLLFWMASSSVQALDTSLSSQAQAYLSQMLRPQLTDSDQLQIQIRKPDSRLQLQPCAAPITFSSSRPIKAGSFTLKASCDYPRHWTRYLRGDIKLFRNVLVSARPLSKGQHLQAGDMRLASINQANLRDGYYSRPQQIIGYQLNRSLPDNRPLTPKLLTPPTLIHQGDTVTIQAGSNGITVEMTGIALEAGSLGQQIRVENSKSGRTIKANVISQGKVKIIR
ncbi:MAG: flagellar basal body P-ring formation chaperone FlgA [Halopseudomonas sp.]